MGHMSRAMTPQYQILCLFVLVALAAPPLGAQRPGCQPASPTRNAMLQQFRRIVTAQGADADSYRLQIDVPQLPDSSVVAVTDSTTCARLSEAQASLFGSAARAVTANRLGTTRFVVFDQGHRVGEWESLSIFDAAFQHVRSLTF